MSEPRGIIAILSSEKQLTPVQELLTEAQIENGKVGRLKMVSRATTESILKDSGFRIQHSKLRKCSYIFPSVDYYLAWYCSSLYIDENVILPEKRQWFAEKYTSQGGTMCISGHVHQIVARKSCS